MAEGIAAHRIIEFGAAVGGLNSDVEVNSEDHQGDDLKDDENLAAIHGIQLKNMHEFVTAEIIYIIMDTYILIHGCTYNMINSAPLLGSKTQGLRCLAHTPGRPSPNATRSRVQYA